MLSKIFNKNLYRPSKNLLETCLKLSINLSKTFQKPFQSNFFQKYFQSNFLQKYFQHNFFFKITFKATFSKNTFKAALNDFHQIFPPAPSFIRREWKGTDKCKLWSLFERKRGKRRKLIRLDLLPTGGAAKGIPRNVATGWSRSVR